MSLNLAGVAIDWITWSTLDIGCSVESKVNANKTELQPQKNHLDQMLNYFIFERRAIVVDT